MIYKIIVINGIAESGKDTFVKYITEQFLKKFPCTGKVINYSSIDTVKMVSRILGRKKKSKTDADRKFLSDLKRIWIEYNDGPFNELKQAIQFNENDTEYKVLFFVHIREPEEIEKIRREFDILTVYVQRGSCKIPNNKSDQSVFGTQANVIIRNNGSKEDLRTEAFLFWKNWILED